MTKALGKNRNIGGLDSRPGASDHYSIFSTLLDEEAKILKKTRETPAPSTIWIDLVKLKSRGRMNLKINAVQHGPSASR